MSKRNKTYGLLTLGLLFLGAYFLLNFFLVVGDFERDKKNIQSHFLRLNDELSSFSGQVNELISNSSPQDLWSSEGLIGHRFNVHVYEDEKLVYWNVNKLPIQSELPNNALPRSGVHEFLNGLYLVKQIEKKGYTLIVSKQLVYSYGYENKNLQTKLNPKLGFPPYLKITLDSSDGHAIFDGQGKPMFNLVLNPFYKSSEWKEWLVFFVFLTGVILLFAGFGNLLSLWRRNKIWFLMLPILIWGVYYYWVQNVNILFEDFSIASPSRYASSEFFPNFLSLIIASVMLLFSVLWIVKALQGKKFSTLKPLIFLVLYPVLLTLFSLFAWLIGTLVSNSTITLEVDELFSLKFDSILSLLIIFTLLFIYFLFARFVIAGLIRSSIPLNRIAVGWFVISILHFFIGELVLNLEENYAFWAFLVNGLLIYFSSKKNNRLNFGYTLITIALFSAFAAYILLEKNKLNEKQKRQLYANQLISDKDPTVELEYLSFKERILTTEQLHSFIKNEEILDPTSFHETISSCCTGVFWDRFDIQYFLFDSNKQAQLNYLGSKQRGFNYFSDVIKNHAEQSEIATTLYYIKDYYKAISYISQEHFVAGDELYTLFIVFRSKKIPEQLGIPRLLINKSANALEDLQGYAIARYSLGNLAMRFGDYNYPTHKAAFLEGLSKENGFIENDGVNHYVLEQESQLIVITKEQPSSLKPLTNFSYLFLFNGILVVLVFIFSGNWSFTRLLELQLSFKIQILLVGLVVIAVVVFSIVAGSFVKEQYNVYTNDNLKEKLHAIELELKQKVGERLHLHSENDVYFLNYLLDKFSSVFVTDINLYNLEGRLIATSQPLLYSKGIVGSQLHPSAMKALKYKFKREFIHFENIGNLTYQAAYVPLLNNAGNLLGYLNLQHFAKQTKFEQQINGFIMAIINSAVLLLVITVVFAIFIANKITLPLRLIHTSLKSVELGKENKPIDYDAPDEIGALVRDYNNKIADLELKAMQLAKSERESAWREMAKQVAHEIKNPLTPMKLTLQHFKRSFDPNAVDAHEKINRVANTLVEQIDTLTHIANEFSTFAKLPQPNEEALDVLSHLNACIDLFKSDGIDFSFSSTIEKAIISADKDLMIRVFNNVLKNAVQAIPDDRVPTISVSVLTSENNVVIRIKDNGIGIKEAEKNKVFVPNFTTKKAGSGLGLAMVKQIVTQHKGEIYFETKENIGTTFYVSFPLLTDQ